MKGDARTHAIRYRLSPFLGPFHGPFTLGSCFLYSEYGTATIQPRDGGTDFTYVLQGHSMQRSCYTHLGTCCSETAQSGVLDVHVHGVIEPTSCAHTASEGNRRRRNATVRAPSVHRHIAVQRHRSLDVRHAGSTSFKLPCKTKHEHLRAHMMRSTTTRRRHARAHRGRRFVRSLLHA